MKHTGLLLSVAPLALFALPVSAQTIAAGTGEQSDTNDRATRNPVVADQASDIVVTGLRRSLASAQAIKRNSDAFVDVVVAQDIGKLPDNTAAESIARIAGVQVTRFSDEANGVLIRGLPDVATSYNGREIYTAELRRVQLQDFPAQALGAIEVYKSGTANMIEPGLAGLVNVRTRRPFDFKGLVIAGGIRGTYNDQSRKYDPVGNVLVSDRWDTGLGEMGFLANVTYAQSQYYNGVRYNESITDSDGLTIASPDSLSGVTVRYPQNVGLYNDGGKRYRPSANFAFQWAPSSDIELYVEGIYQGYRGIHGTDKFENDLRGSQPVLSDVVLVPGTESQVQSLVKTGGNRQQGYRSTGKDYTNTYQIAAGGKWNTGRAKLSTDLAYTWSEYRSRSYSLDFALTNPQKVVVDFFDQGGAAFSLPEFDASDPTNYIWRGYYESRYAVEGHGLQWRSDLDLDTGSDFLHTLQFGFRVTTRHAQLDRGDRYAYTEALRRPSADLPIGDLVMSPNPFRGDVQGFTSYLVPQRDGVMDNHDKLRELSYQALQQLVAQFPNDAGYRNDMAKFATEDVALDPARSFRANEQSYASYLQGKFRFSLGSVEIDGLAGVRIVNTNGRYAGVSNVTDANGDQTQVYRDLRQNYVDILPNASVKIKFTPELQLRLGYTYTRTQPDFGALNPALDIRINPVVDCALPINANKPQCDSTNPYAAVQASGSGGNPDLKPLTSKNYDASLEYYFSKTGFVSAAIFYRDLFGFVNNYTRYTDIPGYGLTQLSQPVNSGEGRIKGAEVSFQSFLDFLPGALKGFGVSANVTYLDGKNRRPDYDANTDTFTYGDFVQILNLSKWTYNAALFYEKSGITTRLSYNRRSQWSTYYGVDIRGERTTDFVKARDRLDFSISYDINKNFTLSADVANILANPFNNYRQDDHAYVFPIDVREEGRYYGLGLRFRFD